MTRRQTTRALVLAGSATRLAYGIGTLLAPEWMARRDLAPQTHDQADLELGPRGGPDQSTAWGIGLSGLGAAAFAGALLADGG